MLVKKPIPTEEIIVGVADVDMDLKTLEGTKLLGLLQDWVGGGGKMNNILVVQN